MNFRQFLESNEKILYIMRGVPGSGKSYKAKQLAGTTGAIFSTDDLFGDDYLKKWDMLKKTGKIGEVLSQFHQENLRRAVEAMDQGISPIVIDNTNIKLWAYRPYVEAAKARGYRFEIAESDFEPWQKYRSGEMSMDDAAEFFAKNNTHGVGVDAVRNMLSGWEHSRPSDFSESSLRDIIEPIPQSQKWHKEGNVFKHTRLVRKAMQVAIGLLQDAAADPDSAFSELDTDLTQEDMNMLRVGGWMHDIGKAGATTVGNEPQPNTYRKGVPLDRYNKPVDPATDKIGAAAHEQPKFFEPQMRKLGSPWQSMYSKSDQQQKDDLWFMIRYHMSLGKEVFNKVKHQLVDPQTGKYINDRKVKLLLVLILMDQMGRFGDAEPQFGLANGLEALRAMQRTADQMKADYDKRNAQRADSLSTPEALRAHLQSKGLTPQQIDQNVKRKFGESRMNFSNWVQSYMINEMGTTEQEKQNLRAIINKLIQGDMAWMKQHDIIVGDKGMYWIANYGLKGKNDINRLVRGLVVQKPPENFSGDPLQLIKSFPFTRFFNQGESDSVAPVNLNNAEMLEKLDGSMTAVFFPTGDPNNPQWHTRKMVSTHEPDMNVRVSAFDGTRPKLMEVAGQYVGRLNFNEEDVIHTYIFEFIHKSSTVITKYKENQWGLYLLAARNIQTHMEEPEDKLDEIAARIGALRPQRWDAIADADEISRMMKQIASEVEDFEGVVFRDRKTGSRMKLKDQDYVQKHHELGTLNFRRLIPKVLEGEAQEIIAYFPHVKQKIELIQQRHNDYVDNAVKVIEHYKNKFSGLSRKEIWGAINKNLDDKFIVGVFMRSLDTEDVRSQVEKELLKLASIPFEKETYKGLQTFKTTSPRYLDLMGLRKLADDEEKEIDDV